MTTDNTIYFRGGGYNCLYNFAAFKVAYDNRTWMTAEHAYQAQKFTESKIKDKIANCPSAYKAKMTAQNCKEKVRDNWFDDSVEIMKTILHAKLSQHQYIKEKLTDSGDKRLVENTDDEFWGRGENGDGENMLGKLWMELRNEYANQ